MKVLSRETKPGSVKLVVGKSLESYPQWEIRAYIDAPHSLRAPAFGIFRREGQGLAWQQERYPLYRHLRFVFEAARMLGPTSIPQGVFGSEGVQVESGASFTELIQTAVALQEAGSYWDGLDSWAHPWTEQWTRDDYVRATRRNAYLRPGETTLRTLLERFGVTAEHFTVEVVGCVAMDDVIQQFEQFRAEASTQEDSD